MVIIDGRDAAHVRGAAARLQAGELVAFPTETVYGLGADAANATAVDAIYRLKGRPSDHPVIVHLLPDADLAAWASPVPPVAHRLVARFWPGPLTLILRRAAGVPAAVSAGQETIGLRSPQHPVALALLQAFAGGAARGIAAPSANRFGRVSPTTAQHVVDEFGERVTVLDGGACAVGIESTILDLSRYESHGAVLLRPGAIDGALLATVLDELPRGADEYAPRAPGTLAAHYAPRTALRLCTRADLQGVPAHVAVWSFAPPAGVAQALWRRAPDDAADYARQLYATLRELDALDVDAIWIESPPEAPGWFAVRDRLVRAQAGAGGEEP